MQEVQKEVLQKKEVKTTFNLGLSQREKIQKDKLILLHMEMQKRVILEDEDLDEEQDDEDDVDV